MTVRLFQPRNATFWVLLLGLGAGLVQSIRFYAPILGRYGVGLGAGALLFGLYAILWLILLAFHNRYPRLPAKLLLVAFVWGAVTSTYWIAMRANGAVLALYGKAFGPAWVRDWAAGLTAPLTEEAAKATALILLLGLAPRLVRTPYDGLLVGAFAGLGFQISEDLVYTVNAAASRFGADQVTAAWATFVSRATAGLVQHVLFSAIFCSGLMWLLGRAGEPRRPRGLLLMLGAVLLHHGWDNYLPYGYLLAGRAGVYPVMAFLAVAGLLLLGLTFRLAARQRRTWIRSILSPEVAAGRITQAEADAARGSDLIADQPDDARVQQARAESNASGRSADRPRHQLGQDLTEIQPGRLHGQGEQ